MKDPTSVVLEPAKWCGFFFGDRDGQRRASTQADGGRLSELRPFPAEETPGASRGVSDRAAASDGVGAASSPCSSMDLSWRRTSKRTDTTDGAPKRPFVF
ncbi:hypothetical protein HPB47_011908 [Ixodes persulcatus]|uniref:Uncharacterized protein n=1 Tax=Ixodes persulcatus TaxID=34615 RepID=A0AC60NV39_IXOPE|nr:hypothetical protein HPB47_011908 [Ixodes persulcatus]